MQCAIRLTTAPQLQLPTAMSECVGVRGVYVHFRYFWQSHAGDVCALIRIYNHSFAGRQQQRGLPAHIGAL